MMPNHRDALVFCEDPHLLTALVGKAQQVCASLDGQVGVLLIQETDLALAASAGASRILQPSAPVQFDSAEPVIALLCRAIEETHPRIVLVGATRLGLEVAPRVAERLGLDYLPWATGIDVDAGSSSARASAQLYSGLGRVEYQFDGPTLVLSAAVGAFQEDGVVEIPEGEPQRLILEAAGLSAGVRVLSARPKSAGNESLEHSPVIIDLGQGVRADDGLEIYRELAGLLHGQMASTRPVAVERNWFPEWLGLSGFTVSPRLCLTLGVAGAVQHMIGIRGSERIAAVNNDESAAIFSQCDYGIVADLYAFLTVFIDRLKARKVRLNETRI